MKIIKLKSIAALVLLLFLGIPAQGQFFKKLKNRAKNAVVKKSTEKIVSKTFDMGLEQRPAKVDTTLFSESYKYSWRYTLQMQHKKGDFNINYHLREGGADFGSTFEMNQGTKIMEGMFMVLDQHNGITIILMEGNGEKFGQILKSPTDAIAEIGEDENFVSDAEFKNIGTKEILGYECQGFQVENEDIEMTMYVALETPVAFNQLDAGQNMKRLPKGFDPKWLEKIGANSLMMEMEVENKKKPKQSARIICVALEKEEKTINLSDYDFSMQKELEERSISKEGN